MRITKFTEIFCDLFQEQWLCYDFANSIMNFLKTSFCAWKRQGLKPLKKTVHRIQQMDQTWGWMGVCHRRSQCFTKSKAASIFDTFLCLFPRHFIENVLLAETNTHIKGKPLTLGEFIMWIGCWLYLATTKGFPEGLYMTGMVVILDSGFCVLRGWIEIYGSALIKKRRHWPTLWILQESKVFH